MSDAAGAFQTGMQPIEPEPNYMRSTGRVAAIAARFIGYLVYIYVLFVEAILLLGFFLLLFGANPSSDFVEWAYRALDRAMKPFRGIFTPIELGTTAGNQIESVFDTSVLFAMIIYGIIGLLVHSLIQWLTHKVQVIERQERNEAAAFEAERIRQANIASTTAMIQGAAPGPTSAPSAPGSIPPPPPEG
jgi:hypothetical protein